MQILREELEKMGFPCDKITVLQDKDGVTVAHVAAGQESYVLKRFAKAEYRREIENYRVLAALGVPTLRVIACTDSAFLMEDMNASPVLRPAVEADMSDIHIAGHLAAWYRKLHGVGCSYVQQHGAAMYDESDLFTRENIAFVRQKTGTQRAPAWRLLEQNFDGISALLRNARRTLTYNDFYYTNMAVARDGSFALMFDYNLLGKGYAYSDLRNVTSSLSEEAGCAFMEAYGGFDPTEKALDDVMNLVTGLVQACQREHFPGWARSMVDEIGTTLTGKIEQLLDT